MTSPADKATDDVRGLVDAMLRIISDSNDEVADAPEDERTDLWPREVDVPLAILSQAASALVLLLERAERAEHQAEELADGLMYVTVDHTGCIYTTADEDAAIKLAKDNLAAVIQRDLAAEVEEYAKDRVKLVATLEAAEARIKELEQERDRVLESGEALCRLLNPHNLPAGAEQQLEATVEQFRRARAVKGE